MKTPKIVLWDIETSHSVVATFGLFNQNIPYSSILADWFIISISFKYLDGKKVYSYAIDKPGQDKAVIKKMHKILCDTDLLVHHNGDSFDIKKFNARAIYWGLDPVPDLTQDDTLKMARKKFKFSSNRLDYLGEFLGVGNKIKTEPGLWLKVLNGEKKAIKSMVRYNKQDVILLENVYKKLKPWVGSKLNMNLMRDTENHCPACGGLEFWRQGHNYTKTKKYPRLKCKTCKYVWIKPNSGIAR